jgi:quinol monooxygenase YgiN
LYFYHIKVVVKDNKLDEFVENLRSLSDVFRKKKECHDICFYRDVDKKSSYSFVAEWETREAMETHFGEKEFTVLVGAARVLGEEFELKVGEEVAEKGGLPLAKEKISIGPQQRK